MNLWASLAVQLILKTLSHFNIIIIIVTFKATSFVKNIMHVHCIQFGKYTKV